MNENIITVNSTKIARSLFVIAAILIVLSVVSQIAAYTTGHHSMHGLVPFLNVDEEYNLPTFFSGLLLLCASIILALICIFEFKRKHKDRYYWGILSLGFLYMTYDEIFMFHEKFIFIFRRIMGNDLPPIFFFAWVIPFSIISVFIIIVFFRFWLMLPKTTKSIFLIAAIMYLGASVGIEFIEGWITSNYGENNLVYEFVATLQESFEMFAIIIFIRTLIRHLSLYGTEIRFKIY